MTPSRKNLLLTGLLAATLASASVFAQAPAAPAAGAPAAAQPAAKGHHHGREGRAASRFEQMQQRHARHLAALKDKLQITPAQEGAWNTFAEAQKPPAAPAGARMDRAEFAKLTTPQRLDLMEKRKAERGAVMAKRTEAVRVFYAALTPEQQKTFDAQAMRRFGRGEHGRGDRRSRHGEHHAR
jgi:Spy/CpxP family protein refolding chaperone